MKLQILFSVFAAAVASDFTWVDANGVNALCGFCDDGEACDAKTGECADGCKDGWTGKMCDEPVCNDVDCGEGGACIAPNRCVCGYLYASENSFDSEENGCYSLRADGLKGAAIALCVITLAITFCGGLQTYLTKGKTE